MVSVAVSRVEDTNMTFVSVMPAPALTVAPVANPDPLIVTGTVPPWTPLVGATLVTVGANADSA
jgi:hypothetical protein